MSSLGYLRSRINSLDLLNSPPGTEQNNAICCDIQSNQPPPPQQQSQSDYDVLRSYDSINSTYRYINNNISNTDTYDQHTLNTVTSSSNTSDNIEENNDNSASLLGSNYFQRATASHCHMQKEALTNEASSDNTDANEGKEEEEKDEILALQGILAVTKEANGSQIAFNTAVELAYNKSQQVRDYLKDQKLTPRDSRKVRNLSIKVIRHENITVVKHKPLLIIRWSNNDDTSNADKLEPDSKYNIEVESDSQKTNKGIDESK